MIGDLPLKVADEGTEPSGKDFTDKAKDLEASRNAVVEAAGVGGGLWLSYIFVLFYFFIAAAGVTHRDLLFESPVKLPFFNVDLPLTGFFSLGPGLLLIVHAYVLLHLVLLAGKVGSFNTELEAQISEDNAEARLRRQLPSNIFVQFLAGPKEVRTGVIGFMLQFVARISLILAPLALLVYFLLKFLPYHDALIAWWQRLAVIADLVLLWLLWPSVARGETTRLRLRDFRRCKIVAWTLASFALFLLVFTIATFPGEWLDENLPSVKIVHFPKEIVDLVRPTWTSLHQLLFAGGVDLVTGRRMSPWSNTLVLPNIDVIDHTKFDTEAKIAALTQTLSLRGRQLEGATLLFADFRKVDFTGADLRGAWLSAADLRNAKFECSSVGTQSACPDLRGAKLDWAKLQGTSLEGVQLQQASLKGAQLQGASLRKARLQGAILEEAQLQGASLEEAQLWGALLTKAWLQAASLDGAELQVASLNLAQMQGASLDKAQLQGAFLANTQLEGASLAGAQLQGAYVFDTQLQGASLVGAQLQDAALIRDFTWRADARNSEGSALVSEPETRPKYHMLGCAFEPWGCDWSSGAFSALKRLIERLVPEGDRREKALNRIAILDPARPWPYKQEQEKVWTDLVQSSPSFNVYEKDLAVRLQELGCDADRGHYVMFKLPLNPININQVYALVAAFLDEAHCPGSRALSGVERLLLQTILDSRRSVSSGHAPATPNQ
jgi:uncharacterized protein YjbI with pentapeptide repeats